MRKPSERIAYAFFHANSKKRYKMDENKLPSLKSSDELTIEVLRKYLLNPQEDYPEPYCMLEYNGVAFSKIGGLAAISGQKKNGKSFVLTMLMAAILGDTVQRTFDYLPGLRVPQRTLEHLGHKPKVLYVDTEMEKLSSAKVLRRVHWLVDWDMKTPIPDNQFNVLWLKNMPKDAPVKAYRYRYRLIKSAIDLLKPDIVFIDGLRDLVSSINDEEAGTQILEELASIAEERQMCIWLALHQNPGRAADTEEAKMRGWIGTELGNKVSDTLVSIKEKKNGQVTFRVVQQDARDKDMDDWQYEITDDAGKLGIPKIVNNPGDSKRAKAEHDKEEDIRRWIEEAYAKYEWPMSRNNIKTRVFGDIGGQKSDGRQQANLDFAISLGLFVESTVKSGGHYMLDLPDRLPF